MNKWMMRSARTSRSLQREICAALKLKRLRPSKTNNMGPQQHPQRGRNLHLLCLIVGVPGDSTSIFESMTEQGTDFCDVLFSRHLQDFDQAYTSTGLHARSGPKSCLNPNLWIACVFLRHLLYGHFADGIDRIGVLNLQGFAIFWPDAAHVVVQLVRLFREGRLPKSHVQYRPAKPAA